jgi:hypothetical protein
MTAQVFPPSFATTTFLRKRIDTLKIAAMLPAFDRALCPGRRRTPGLRKFVTFSSATGESMAPQVDDAPDAATHNLAMCRILTAAGISSASLAPIVSVSLFSDRLPPPTSLAKRRKDVEDEDELDDEEEEDDVEDDEDDDDDDEFDDDEEEFEEEFEDDELDDDDDIFYDDDEDE